MSLINILHLSDIHFRQKVTDTFRDDVKVKILKAIRFHIEKRPYFSPDFVAVTGDIAFSGKEEEYEVAEAFFNELKEILRKDAVFLVVPGNHDLDRDKLDRFASLYHVVTNHLTNEFLDHPNQFKHKINPKFKAFRTFLEKLNPELYQKEEDYFWVKDFRNKNVSFLGLNSCWACEGDYDKNNITLGYPQVMKALNQSNLKNKILLMHHPTINWFNENDFARYCDEIYKNCGLILHGHTHSDLARVIQSPSYSFIRLAANASYTKDKEGFLGFQFIEVNFEKGKTDVTVWPYRSELRGMVRFVPDYHRYEAQDGPFFELSTGGKLSVKSKKREQKQNNISLKIPIAYKEWVVAYHSNMDIDLLRKKGEPLTISLPEVYIPIDTRVCNESWTRISKRIKQKNEMNEGEIQLLEERRGVGCLDIEILAAFCNPILIKGDAGMGKTTLIKHLTYTIIHDTCHSLLRGFLPVMIFMKDFWPIYNKKLKEGKKKFEELMSLYLEKIECPLTWKDINDFLNKNRVLFLIDGFDEVPEHLRTNLVHIINNFRINNRPNRFLLTSRPYGISEEIEKLFDDHVHEIEHLNDAKVDYFISRWFSAVTGRAEGEGKITSESMIRDIRHHKKISPFIENPLLLTAVCILYYDGKRLPEQRADLYNRIIGNLIHRRFSEETDPERENEVLEFLMCLAFETQKKNRKTIEFDDAFMVIKKTFRKAEEESVIKHNIRMRNLLEKIELDCGLFNRLSSEEIEFRHLTFQEFLAAKYMVYMDIDLEEFLKSDWWEETLLLYVGLISLDMKKRSNEIVKTILTTEAKDEKALTNLRRLGIKALLDMQPSKREDEIVSIARQQLYQIMNSALGILKRDEAGELVGKLKDTRISYSNFVLIPKGEFIRGANDGLFHEEPESRIYLDDFMMGVYPVTNHEFKRFIDNRGYQEKGFWSTEGWEWRCKKNITEPAFWFVQQWNKANFPVVGVSWFEAAAYSRWLLEFLGKSYRLPTEAEWEKAARGPGGNIYSWGDNFNNKYCNTIELGLGRTTPVGIFPKNKSYYGCFDMIGNVSEWCSDWYGAGYYESSPTSNPEGPFEGLGRVVRGGGWDSAFGDCRAASRNWLSPDSRKNTVGFRLAYSIIEEEQEELTKKGR